ncbi:rod shape-determining protein MreD [Nocardioides litoris]|uniref:rod shape-determining protein MreD n=1 Tax=Nocardioides litoris TaxID=1926648 RepID=UPI0011239E46|nr:rod shape-determining protein MreD [Nocardioides litoris]
MTDLHARPATRPARPAARTTAAGTGDAARWLLAALAVGVALVLQTTVGAELAWRGVGPDLVLLVVVAGGLARGARFGIVLGFVAGLLVDLAPPADHVAGRWALALLVVGYVAGRVRQDGPVGVAGSLATVAACSFLGTSVFALSGLVLADRAGDVPGLLTVVGVGVGWDLLAGVLVLPAMAWAFARLDPEGAPTR